MRVGLDVRCLGTLQRFRGVGTVARELLEGLTRDPQDLDPVLLRFRDQEPALPAGESLSLGPAPPNYRAGAWLLDKARVPAACLRGRLDVLHVVAPMELLYGYHIWPGMPPVVVTAYDVIPALLPERSFPVYPWFTRRLYFHYLHLMKKAARILCISRATADDLVGRFGFPSRAVEVVPLGVQQAFRPAESAAALQRELDRLGVRPPYLLHVGGDSPHKNIETVLAAYARLRERGQRLQLVLAGRYDTPALQAPLAQLAGRLGPESVRVLGYVGEDDLVRLYQGAEVFVFPSLCEGFGLPPLEAMACGTPTVVSDAPALREVAGPGASVAAARDPGDVARKVEELLGDAALRQERSAAGREWAARFTWERTVAQTREAYRAVTGRGGSPRRSP